MESLLKLYVYLIRWREHRFGVHVNYEYLPSLISHTIYPMHMDLLWFKHGFLGFSEFLIPKGKEHSQRYDDRSDYFQSWLGTYYLNRIRINKITDPRKLVLLLARSAIEDQRAWLWSCGIKLKLAKVLPSSLKLVEQRIIYGKPQLIYYGEMISAVDDHISRNNNKDLLFTLGQEIAAIYNQQRFKTPFLAPDDKPTRGKLKIKLFGYYAVTVVNPKKYIVTYACGTLDNKLKISAELLKFIKHAQLSGPALA